jgi:AraC-like DNA-binding protein
MDGRTKIHIDEHGNPYKLPEGRPFKKVSFEDREYVLNNAFCTTKKEMAAHLGMSVPSLDKHFAQEIAGSRAKWINKTLIAAELALAEGVPAVITKMLGSLCGMSDTSKIEHTGKDGGAIELVSKPPPISREEWMKQYNQRLVNPNPEMEILPSDEFDD